MTVIATDGRTMAADTLVTCQGELLARRRKIHRLKDGRIVGASGPSTDCAEIIRWLDEGGEKPSLGDGVAAIILNRDGSVSWVDNKCVVLHDNVIPYAIGCGANVAIGAMLAGKTPKQAVQIACQRHLDCGGEITVLKRR